MRKELLIAIGVLLLLASGLPYQCLNEIPADWEETPIARCMDPEHQARARS